MLVKNISDVPHRYPIGRNYISWAPGEVRNVSEAIGNHVVHVHPHKMHVYVEEPVALEEEPSDGDGIVSYGDLQDGDVGGTGSEDDGIGNDDDDDRSENGSEETPSETPPRRRRSSRSSG